MNENFYGNLRACRIKDITTESPSCEWGGKYVELFFKNPVTVESFRDHFKDYCSGKSGLHCPQSYGVYHPNFLLFAAHLQYDVQFVASFGLIINPAKKRKWISPKKADKVGILLLPMVPKYIHPVDDAERGIEEVPKSDPLGRVARNFFNSMDDIVKYYIEYELGGTFESGVEKIALGQITK